MRNSPFVCVRSIENIKIRAKLQKRAGREKHLGLYSFLLNFELCQK
jgi:hypothetical protein